MLNWLFKDSDHLSEHVSIERNMEVSVDSVQLEERKTETSELIVIWNNSQLFLPN